ncbi:MAG: SDR family oxidoreductase [Chloroflexi bacterium]|nr:SDR family oxidoreductase [Chloroflexota bacterium]
MSEEMRGGEDWALVLGASSGFGAATSLALARSGMNVFGVHLDRRATLPNAQRVADEIRALGRQAFFFNTNAADEGKRAEVLEKVEEVCQSEHGSRVRAFLHSLAFGTTLPYIARNGGEAITRAQMDMTLDVMANSLVYWVQDLVARGLLVKGSRVFAMTSEGSTRAITNYGAVSAAKAALEAHMRQLAVELAPMGIACNTIRAGVTDTPALRKIPGNELLVSEGRRRNPSGRMTTPEDVAGAIAALCAPGAYWITGNVIGVDGGEGLAV